MPEIQSKTFFCNMSRKIFISVFLLLVSMASTAATHVDSLLQVLHNPRSEYVFVIAHRADWRGAPENSIQGIENAIAMGVDMVEIDIQRTKDGRFILMHDRTLNRTTTGKGAVADWPLDSLQQFTLRSGNSIKTRRHIPTLDEALAVCKDRVLVNIDKGGEYISEILPIIRRMGVERQVIIKGKYTVDKVKAVYGQNTDNSHQRIIKTM